MAVNARAATAMTPIFSSDQASDRVRGIDDPCQCWLSCPSGEKRLHVRIGPGDGPQLGGVALEMDPAVLQHDEFRLVRLHAVRLLEDDVAPFPRCGMFGHI